MGATISSSAANLTTEQLDLRLLGDRLPFADGEIRVLYAAYQLFLQRGSGINEDSNDPPEPRTFLDDWSTSIGAPGQFDTLQDKVLPKHFGNALYEAAFCVKGDTARYRTTNHPPPQQPLLHQQRACVDEWTRKTRLETFFDGLAQCSRRGPTSALTVLFHTTVLMERRFEKSQNAPDDTAATITTNNEKEEDEEEDANEKSVSALTFATIGYLLARATKHLQQPEASIVEETFEAGQEAHTNDVRALAHSIVAKARGRRKRYGLPDDCPFLLQCRVELPDILVWAEAAAPMFGHCLPTFFHYCLFPSKPIPRGRTAFEQPELNDESFILTSSADRFALACTSPHLNGPWFRLYTSAADGLSFNRLLTAVLGYGGPTLLVIRSTTGSVFGAYTSSPWKEAKDFYGNTDCFLYQLKPTMSVYRPTGSATNYMYCNPAARSRGYDQQAHGIGFGGTIDQPRLFLPELLDDACYASTRDLTFENGKLDSSTDTTSFFVDSIEIWGVGGEEAVTAALATRTVKRALKDEAIQKARKVDRAQFLDDFRAGTFDSKAFAHRQQVDGRGQEDMEERARDKSKEYEYAK